MKTMTGTSYKANGLRGEMVIVEASHEALQNYGESALSPTTAIRLKRRPFSRLRRRIGRGSRVLDPMHRTYYIDGPSFEEFLAPRRVSDGLSSPAILFANHAAPCRQALGRMLLHPLGELRRAHQAGLHRDVGEFRSGDGLLAAIYRRGETAEHGDDLDHDRTTPSLR